MSGGGEQWFWIKTASLGGGCWWTTCVVVPGEGQSTEHGRGCKTRNHRPVGDGEVTGPETQLHREIPIILKALATTASS